MLVSDGHVRPTPSHLVQYSRPASPLLPAPYRTPSSDILGYPLETDGSFGGPETSSTLHQALQDMVLASHVSPHPSAELVKHKYMSAHTRRLESENEMIR
jgi:hypothetical protein